MEKKHKEETSAEKEHKDEALTTSQMFSGVMEKLKKLSEDLNEFGVLLENIELLTKEASTA